MTPAGNHMPEPAGERQPAILLVEDDVLQRIGVAEHLRQNGFSVVEAATADEAKAVLEAGVEVDLVFTDITMPAGIDGVALAQWAARRFAELPVMLTSALQSALDIALIACPQAKGVILKPYDYDALVRRLRALLELKVRKG
jgi:DNA-binding response OmpR family regulator